MQFEGKPLGPILALLLVVCGIKSKLHSVVGKHTLSKAEKSELCALPYKFSSQSLHKFETNRDIYTVV